MSKITRQRQNGMTLIEAIVSISILTVAIIGPIALAQQSLHSSRSVREEMIATHLAEEGIEIIRNIRDNNAADDTSATHTHWIDDIFNRCKGNGCVVDVTEQREQNAWRAVQAVRSCSNADCSNRSPVYINPQTGLYRQFNAAPSAPWVPTPFTRVITMEGIDNANNPVRQVRITARVTYTGYNHRLHEIVVSNDIYNWFPQLDY